MRAAFSLLAVAVLACWTAGCSNSSPDAPDDTAERQSAPAASELAENSASSDEPADDESAADQTADDEPQPPTEDEVLDAVRTLYATGKFEEAEAQFAAALTDFPDSVTVNEFHGQAAAALLRADRKQQSYNHHRALTDFYFAGNYDRRAVDVLFGRQLGELASLADEIAGPPTAEDVFDDYAARAASLPSRGPHAAVVTIQRALHRVEQGRTNEARALLDELQFAATKALDAAPADEDPVHPVADALEGRWRVEYAAADGDPQAARAAFLDFLFGQAQIHPKFATVRSRFASEHVSAAQSLAYTDPDAADAALARLDEFEKTAIAIRDDDALTASWRSERGYLNIDRAREVIEQSRQRFALIGKPAQFPDNADGWVGVDAALTGDQLRGKVVLLDFFAVWCGPCIATFPHLRAWHDEFSPQGLQVIGVTAYQGFDWDADAGRSKRVADLAPAAERAGMEKFAAHHELPYPIAFTPDRALQTNYMVSGIPHVVLIDRGGKVRLFRIGNLPQNARDLERAIRECIAEAPPAEADSVEADAAPTDAAAPLATAAP